MERRRDPTFRAVVAQMLPGLVQQGFQLADRGLSQGYTWVDVEYLGGRSAENRFTKEILQLYHIPSSQCLGARVTVVTSSQTAATPEITFAQWTYKSDSLAAPEREQLVKQIDAWVGMHFDGPKRLRAD